MRYRLVAADWLRPNLSKYEYILEGTFSDDFLEQKNRQGYNVYSFPNYPSGEGIKYAKGRDIDIFEYVFLDMDLKDKIYSSKENFLEVLAEFSLEHDLMPSMTVDSGHGIHVYWQISDLTRESYGILQFQLIQKFKTDDSVWTVLQILRTPGFLNVKNKDNFKPVVFIDSFSSDKIYTTDQLSAVLPEISDDNLNRLQRHFNKIDGVEENILEGIEEEDIPEKFFTLMEKSEKARLLFEDPYAFKNDRSSADMALANLLFSNNFSKSEAFSVIKNSEKARSRSDATDYAWNTVSKVYSDRVETQVESAWEQRNRGQFMNLGPPIHGPLIWDRLRDKWRTRQILGLVGGSGTGKTTVSLKVFKDILNNNPDDKIAIFFSLEMSKGEIFDRWEKLVGNDKNLWSRLFVETNEEDDGSLRSINLQYIFNRTKEIEKCTGKQVLIVCIDHVDIVNPVIYLDQKPNFSADKKECEVRSQKSVILRKEAFCRIFKELAKSLNCFIIIQSQTTKDQDKGGDVPLNKNAAFGSTKFSWNMDYVMTIHQPLKRVYDKTNLRVLAYRYGKVRESSPDDEIVPGVDYLAKFDAVTGEFKTLSIKEYEEFSELVVECRQLARDDTKNAVGYNRGPLRVLPKEVKRRKSQ